jgi:Peptidase family M28
MFRLRRVVGLGFLAAATAVPLRAQTFPTNDPVIRHIYALGMDSTHLYSLAHSLFDSLGPRLQGSPQTKAAQDWLVSMYKSWGISAREEQYGTWRGWIRGPSHIDLISPRVRSLEGQMLGWSPGTGGKDVVYSTIILPSFHDSTEFVKWLPQAKGKLVLIAPPMPTCRPWDQWLQYATAASAARMDTLVSEIKADWNRRGPNGADVRGTGYSAALGGGELGVRLEDGGAGGIISSRPKLTFPTALPESLMAGGRGGGRGGRGGGRGGFGRGGRGGNAASVDLSLNLANGTVSVDSAGLQAAIRAASGPSGPNGFGAMEIFETYNTKTPTIALNCDDYSLVYRLTEEGDSPKLRLNLTSKLLGEQPVFNVIGEIKGSEKPDEYVVLSAHFDSWDGGSGATDNGTGTLTMMEAMRILRLAYPQPRRTILVGHWTGEEEGEVGSKAFTEDHPEVIKGLQDVFNQDNGTGRIERISGGGMVHSPEHINMWLSAIPTEWKDSLGTNLPGGPSGSGSDGYSVTCYGVPTSDLGALSWDYSTMTWHTERDTYDKVVFDDLKFNATLTAMLAYEAAQDPTMIPHEKVDMNAAAAGGGFGGRGRAWPTCEKAPRKTKPRLK